MAQAVVFTPDIFGALEIKKNKTYTSDNITADANIVILTTGVQLYKGIKNIRGIRVVVTNSNVTDAVSPLSNIPFFWEEGKPLKFNADSTYMFLDDGVVAYGVMVE